MVEDELLVQQAQRDTNLKVTDREVQDQVEQTVQNVRKQFTSGAEFQSQLRAAGFGSEEEWRRWLADNQRRSILRDRLLDELRQKGKLRPIPPSESQLRAFWGQNRGQQSKRPASVSFRQIVIAPKPDSAAKARGPRPAGGGRRAAAAPAALPGGAPSAPPARRYHDPNEPKLADALPTSQLPPDYLKAIGSDSMPGLKPVIAVGEGTGRARFVVLELLRRLPEGEFAFEDVKDRIRDALSQRLADQHYLDLLRRTTYVDIRL